MIAPRSQVVPEIAPSSDPWQASWYSWHESEVPERRSQRGGGRSGSPSLQNGCSNFRTLLCSESLTEVWEALLGRTSSQEYVIDSWTQLLTFN